VGESEDGSLGFRLWGLGSRVYLVGECEDESRDRVRLRPNWALVGDPYLRSQGVLGLGQDIGLTV